MIMDENLKLKLKEFENAFKAFISIIESGVERDVKNALLIKENFDGQLTSLEAKIKSFQSVVSGDKTILQQLNELGQKLTEIWEITGFVGKKEYVLRSKSLQDRIYGKLPWMKQCLRYIHTAVEKIAESR